MITIKQFNDDACTFLRMMGEQSFWASESKIAAAKKGFFTAFMNTETKTPEEKEQVQITFWSMMNQFTRRAIRMDKVQP